MKQKFLKKAKVAAATTLAALSFFLPRASARDYDEDLPARNPGKRSVYESNYKPEIAKETKLKEKSDRGLNLDLATDIGFTHPSTGLKVRENWREGYLPDKNMDRELKTHNSELYMDIGFCIEPNMVTKNGWQVGLPIFYNLNLFTGSLNAMSLGGTKKRLASATTFWWDEVLVAALDLEKKVPAVGLSLKKDNLFFRYAIQPYELYNRNYQGADNLGGPNSSSLVESEKVGSGITHRFDLGYAIRKDLVDYSSYLRNVKKDERVANLGLTLEVLDEGSWMAGIFLSSDFRILDDD